MAILPVGMEHMPTDQSALSYMEMEVGREPARPQIRQEPVIMVI